MNTELILYRLEQLEKDVAHLDEKILSLKRELGGEELPKKKADWAQVLVAIFGTIATIIAGYLAVKG